MNESPPKTLSVLKDQHDLRVSFCSFQADSECFVTASAVIFQQLLFLTLTLAP